MVHIGDNDEYRRAVLALAVEAGWPQVRLWDGAVIGAPGGMTWEQFTVHGAGRPGALAEAVGKLERLLGRKVGVHDGTRE